MGPLRRYHWLAGQHPHHVNYGEVPRLLLRIPGGADSLLFKELNLIILIPAAYHMYFPADPLLLCYMLPHKAGHGCAVCACPCGLISHDFTLLHLSRPAFSR